MRIQNSMTVLVIYLEISHMAKHNIYDIWIEIFIIYPNELKTYLQLMLFWSFISKC